MTGNVFADLGLPDADDLAAKTDLAIGIAKLIQRSGLTQSQVAKLARWTQPKVSALMNGRLDDISVERLLRVAHALNYCVRIVVEPVSAGVASTTVEISDAFAVAR